jgi:hypothetical protein
VTLKELLNKQLLVEHQTSSDEIDKLREAAHRSLRDAGLSGLSADGRFKLAYEAIVLFAKMALACGGYRVKGRGAHHTTFVALPLVMGRSVSADADYFDRCRRKRNELTYERADVVSSKDAEDVLLEATKFGDIVEDWISDHYPEFKA